ncbi:MAG: ATP-binding protein [Acidimicrobiales bacterium]
MLSRARAFSASLTTAAAAREFLHGTLRSWGCEHLEEVAVMLANEVVSNAVLHARSEVGLSVRLANHVLRVEVSDRDPSLPRLRPPVAEVGTGGRGLLLVDALSSRWGSRPHGEGKVVWFELEADDQPRW